MKLVYFILFVASALTMLPRHALNQQKEEELYTQGVAGRGRYSWTNGRAWKVLDSQSKIAFLKGIDEGIMLLLRESSDGSSATTRNEIVQAKAEDFMGVAGFRFSDLVQQVDDFYRDSSDIRIPVVDAYKFTVKKLKGARQVELEDYLAALRRTYNH